MLPDFPETKSKLRELITQYMRRRSRQDPVLSQISVEHHLEGKGMSSKPIDGELEVTGYQELSVPYTINREDIIKKGIDVFIENAEKMAEEIMKHQSQLLFKKLNEITDKTGNKIDAKGELTFEHMLEMFEKTWIDFDDSGKPQMESMMIVCGPGFAEKYGDKLAAWDKDPVCIARYEEIMKKKKKEWDDRESRRKLVD